MAQHPRVREARSFICTCEELLLGVEDGRGEHGETRIPFSLSLCTVTAL
jgi:hypothetical protein